MTTPICFIDCETTGLDSRIHQPYEVSAWIAHWERPYTARLAHTLEYADPGALKIGGYFERGFAPFDGPPRWGNAAGADRLTLTDLLQGVTLVGSNPSFDAQMLRRAIGCEVWHHRLIDVSQGAMWLLGLDRPPGLARAAELLRDRGFEIPDADHTAEGDVRATRAVYEALRDLQSTIGAHQAAKPGTTITGGAR